MSEWQPCNCITEINEKLADDRLELDVALMFSGNTLVVRPFSRLMRKDNGRPETRSGRKTIFAATFCPFCGNAYSAPLPGDQDHER